MMNTQALPVAERKSEIVDLTEGMSDLDVESGTEDNNGGEETKDIGVPLDSKKKRKDRRGGKKSKKAKELAKLRKLEEAQYAAEASDKGTFTFKSQVPLADNLPTQMQPAREHSQKQPASPRSLNPIHSSHTAC
jgi:hypothetical protein